MLTARDEVMDKVNGLQVGADDYFGARGGAYARSGAGI